MERDTTASAGTADEVISLIPEGDNPLTDEHNLEQAREVASNLWTDSDVTRVEANGAGDGDVVEAYKECFKGTFQVSVDHYGISVSDIGYATFEIHDERGYYLLEEIEVEAGIKLHDRLNDAACGVVEQHKEQRAREREYRSMVL